MSDIDDIDTPYKVDFTQQGVVVKNCSAACSNGSDDGAGDGQASA